MLLALIFNPIAPSKYIYISFAPTPLFKNTRSKKPTRSISKIYVLNVRFL